MPTWPAWWAATNSTKAAGQPSGQSIPVLSARSMAARMTVSSAGQATSRTMARSAVHSMLTSAVRSGLAARSTPAVSISTGYRAASGARCGRLGGHWLGAGLRRAAGDPPGGEQPGGEGDGAARDDIQVFWSKCPGLLRSTIRLLIGRFHMESRFIAHPSDWLPPMPCRTGQHRECARERPAGTSSPPDAGRVPRPAAGGAAAAKAPYPEQRVTRRNERVYDSRRLAGPHQAR